LQNEHLRLEVGADGLRLEERATGWRLEGLHHFLDMGDRGDTYNFGAVPGDGPVVSSLAGHEVLERGPTRATLRLRYRLAIPARLDVGRDARSDELLDHDIVTDVSLWRGCPRVDFRTALVNRARDHRLRVGFPLPLRADAVHADSAFSVVRRDVAPPAAAEWLEAPSDARPLRSFVALEQGGRGVALLARGVAEYACAPDGAGGGMALTLLRAVDALARDDLPERPGLAGPPYETPGAQCLRAHEFRYALLPYRGGWREAGVARQARALCAPPLVSLCPDGAGSGPAEVSLGELPDGWWVTSMRAAPGGGALLRAVNGAGRAMAHPDGAGQMVPPWGIIRRGFERP